MKGTRNIRKICLSVLLAIYLLCVFWGVFLYHRMPCLNFNVNYVPFRTIATDVIRIVSGDASVARNAAKYLVLNLLLFVSFGCLLYMIGEKMQVYKRFIFAPLALSLLIELGHYLTHLGVADIDNVILNVCGATIGFLAAALLKRINSGFTMKKHNC